MALTKSSLIIYTALVIGILGILAFQLLNLTTTSMWHDEAFSGLLVQYDFSEMMYRIGLDVHPPLYYIAVNTWTDILGNSLFTLRLFSIFLGLLTVVGTFLLAKEIYKKHSIALLSAILLLFNSFQIQYNMEARMYTLGAFFVVFATLFFLKGLKTSHLLWWILYAGFALAAIYTHYYTAFPIIAHGLYLIFKERHSLFKISGWFQNKTIRFATFAYGLIFIGYIPWLPTFVFQLQQVQENFWIPQMTLWSVPSTIFAMISGAGATDPDKFPHVLIGGTILVIAALLFSLKATKNIGRMLPLFVLVFPFIAVVGISLKTSIYLDRYFIFLLPFLMMVIAASISLIPIPSFRKLVTLLAIVSMASSFPLYWKDFQPETKPGMQQAAKYINERAQPEDSVVSSSAFTYFTFRYYNETDIPEKLYAPVALDHFSGTALLTEEDTISNFNELQSSKVWKIDTSGFGGSEPDAPDSWTLLSEKGILDLYDYRGWIIVQEYQTN